MAELTLIETGVSEYPDPILPRLAGRLAVWIRRDRERRFLTQMNARERADLRLSPADVEAEAAKPFWRK